MKYNVTKESIIEKTYSFENLPYPLFYKSRETRDSFFLKGGKEGGI